MIKIIIYSIFLFYIFACAPSTRYSSIKKYRSEKLENAKRADNNYSGSLSDFVENWIGTPYRFGGLSKNGIDCSGLTYIFYRDFYEKKIPRVSRDQYLNGYKIGMHRAQEGDLVFFRGVRGAGIDHVGIYLGDKRFIHASTTEGVIISDLNEKYYKKRFVGVCRY